MRSAKSGLLIGSLLACAASGARAETVDLTCSTAEHPQAVAAYVRLDLAAGTAATWLTGQGAPKPKPARIGASQVTWSDDFPPYVVTYTLDRSNGALTSEIAPSNSRAPRTAYVCKKAAPAF